MAGSMVGGLGCVRHDRMVVEMSLNQLGVFRKVLMAPDKTGKINIPPRLYRIGDIVRNTTFSRQTIHNYTTMGLIREAERTEGGHRLYDESVFARLAVIDELRKTKTLVQIKEMLDGQA
jgi:hypothetical protein